MSMKIRNIPILTCKESRRFEKEIEGNKDKYISKEEYNNSVLLANKVLMNSEL